MGLWDSIKHQLIDIIQWLDESNDTMVYRFERYANEIKYGAKLVVRESQSAVFVNEGKIADVFRPGTYTLTTQNLPILSTLLGWKYGFESPFKAEVYFVNTKRFTDNKWGTKNPIMLRDAEFGPLRLRAFGTYALRVKDPAQLIREIAGTNGRFTVEEITEQLRNMIVSRFADILGESKIPALDLAANYNELGDFIAKKIQPEFEPYGLEVLNMLVENISLPPEVEKVLDQRTSMGVIGNLQAYTQFQAANAIPDAAKNPGGLAAAGVGLGMGVAMAGQMAPAMAPAPGAGPGMPPPLPQAVAFFVGVGGQQQGPYDMQTLQQQVLAGRVNRETLVWKNGMAQWTAAGQVPELAGLFANTPPPLPPA
ncbi:MAG: SPFH domain-containing protein [Planctomycetota bacterium]|nr:SPFH domain-containing protein [Planctomycetota bacterium]